MRSLFSRPGMKMPSPQLDMFSTPESRPASAMPRNVELMWERAFTQEVELEILAFAASRPTDWLSFSDFREALARHDISTCLGHVLGRIARAGLLEEKRVYLGRGLEADRPGSPDYQGYTCRWKAVE